MKRVLIVLVVAMLAAAAVPAEAKKRGVVRVAGGTNIGGVGLAIDASYDPRLDTFLPGYKIVNVVLINQSFDIVGLNPEKDVWGVRLEGAQKPIRAIHDLRGQDPKAWSSLPERARGKVAYPLVLPIGAHEVIDLFVPAEHDLDLFTELAVDIKSLASKIEVLVRE